MKTRFLILVLLLTLLSASAENIWMEQDGKMVTANKIILKLSEESAPLLGVDPALTLDSRTELTESLLISGATDFYPLFINSHTFSTKHYEFDLHQFYVLEFENGINVFPMLEQLNVLTDIEVAEANFQVTVATVPNDPFYPDQWGHDNTGQAGPSNVGIPDCDMDTDLAWDITTGDEDVIIAILDTGIASHMEFGDRLLPGWNVMNNNGNTNDVFGHGTQCAGIAAAQGNNGIGVAGIAWDARLMPVKVLTDGGSGDQVTLANGIQYATDNGASVISMSLQFGQEYVTVTDNAINFAVSNGTVVMAASGNFDQGVVTYPAQYDNCICVGSLSPCNERKSYSSCDGENFWGSNYGADLEFLTPGVLINTTTQTGGYTASFNGTSSACPAGAGVAALVMSAAPELTPEVVREILNASCDDLYGAGWDSQSGWGRLNANTAVSMAFEMSCVNNWIPGDVNNDGGLDVLDLVTIANVIVGVIQDLEICEEWAADYNNNGIINVLDIIQIINVIVAP